MPYYVMRRVDGKPLDEVVRTSSVEERLALVPNLLAICDAAAYAHARGILHRDIKPTNILVGPFGETLLIDWGLARELSDRSPEATIAPSDADGLTRAGTVTGTPGFMAPEQARGEALDARADVYALGATLFYVLSGVTPYAGRGETEMMTLAAAQRAPDWRQLPERVPRDLRAIVEKAMAGDPAARYPDGAALAADLRRFVTGNLVGAHRYGRLEQLRRFLRRHRAAASIAAASLVVLIVGGVLSVRKIVDERDDARAARALAEQRQHEAIDTAERRLVETALASATRDPLATIGALRKLSPGSKRWRDAAVAAQAALVRGIPSGITTAGRSYLLSLSPDARRALALFDDQGETAVIVFDLVSMTRREVLRTRAPRTHGERRRGVWVDDGAIAYGTRRELSIVDARTGAVLRQIALPDELQEVFGDHRGKLLVHAGASLHELAPGARELGPALVGGVDRAKATLDLSAVALARSGAIDVWSRGQLVSLARARRGVAIDELAIDGAFVGARTGGDLIQWQVDGKVAIEHARWHLPLASSSSSTTGSCWRSPRTR